MALHQFTGPRLPIAKILVDGRPAAAVCGANDQAAGGGWAAGPRVELRDGRLATGVGLEERREVPDDDGQRQQAAAGIDDLDCPRKPRLRGQGPGPTADERRRAEVQVMAKADVRI